MRSYELFISLHNLRREDICHAGALVLGAISITPRSAVGACPLSARRDASIDASLMEE
jgi:hypothetical protein